MANSPVLWGPNNTAINLQNAELFGTGALIDSNGSKNYITYCNFENANTTGWSLGTTGTLTNGIPTGTPAFGSGASGNLSIAVTSSSPIIGNYSLSYTSSAATTAGNMVSTDAITIDSEWQAKVLTWKFAYKASSNASNGNFSGTSSNSFGVAVYDVTNSAYLGAAGNFNIIQSSGVGISTGTFQTASNTTQIRFMIYNVTASAGAITMLFDDFYLGPQTYAIAPAMSDWQSYTPTGSWTANSTYTGQWRRVGDSAEIHARVACSGAPTSANLTINIPSGLVIDTAKLTSSVSGYSVILGQATLNDSNTFGYKAYPVYSSTTAVLIAYQSATTGAGSAVTQAAPFTFGNGDSVDVAFMVPIVGWSSNSVMSSDTATNVVAASAQSSTAQRVNINVTQNLKFGTVDFDTAGAITQASGTISITTGNWSGGNFKYTAPVSGVYEVDGSVAFTPSSSVTGYDFALMIFKNGVEWFRQTQNSPDASATNSRFPIVYLRRLMQLNAGDYVDFRCVTNLSSTTDATPLYFNIQRLSGPAVITATDTVACRYTTGAGNAVANNTTTYIDFGTKDYDTNNMVLGAASGNVTTSGTGWRAIIPVSGKYYIYASSMSSSGGGWAAGEEWGMGIFKNGASVQYLGSFAQATHSTYMTTHICGVYNLVAGDRIEITIYQSSGASLNISTDSLRNEVCILRVGN